MIGKDLYMYSQYATEQQNPTDVSMPKIGDQTRS